MAKKTRPATERKISLGRPVWSGTVSFGLINIPVQLYMGVRRKDVRFHLLHEKDHARLEQRLVCPAEKDKEVPRDEVVKGFELQPNQHVVVTPQEMESLAPKASHTIELTSFVDMASIDPLYFDKPYYVLPGERAGKAYQLLIEALRGQKKVAAGKFVMRNKEYIAVLRPVKNFLCLETLHFADEVVLADDIRWDAQEFKITDAEKRMAEQLIESLATPFEPDQLHDDYRQALRELIEKKAAGREIAAAPEVEKTEPQVIDLMAALQKSLHEAKRQRPRRVA